MRFATYDDGDGPGRAAALSDTDHLHPLPDGTTLLDLVREGSAALHTAGAAALASAAPGPHVRDVRLLPPLRPPTVRDFVTFEQHVAGVRRSVDSASGIPEQWYEAPAFYFTNPYALVGAYDDVPVPPGCHALDFELEVAAVIGREGRDLTPEQARDHIVGYTIFNDWSARDLQSAEMKVGLGPCKGKDSAATLGPCLVTADALAPYRDSEGFLNLALTAEINGEIVGADSLAHMSWTFEEMTAYASRGTYVMPGDVLGSGTCGNGGCLAELWGVRGEQSPPPLQPGDTVTLTVEALGSVSNTIVPGTSPAPIPLPKARRRNRT
ncbi:fumarylacetoacetate hydrolase family protein [Streptomyces sp. NPDC054863]